MSSVAAPVPAILIVDDEASVRDSLTEWFSQEAWDVDSAGDAAEALARLGRKNYQLALLDIRLPGMDGLELQRRIRDHAPDITVIFMTAYASVDTAVRAMKEGAYDYITKPFQPDEFTQVIRNALSDRAALAAGASAGPALVGKSPSFTAVMELVETVAATDATVVISGESGTGKELLARRIHAKSPRSFFPFVAVNCGGLSETLLESELFGHEKGAFTGAQYRRKGRLELASRGTLFLDEIGEIPMKMQVDLLRVLEEKSITRLGSERSFPVDFRVIAATNRDLHKMVEEGKFRRDLFFRLNVMTVSVPPLRERRQDIPLLADHFLEFHAPGGAKKSFSAEAVALLLQYDWPGNVRELRNVVERAVILSKGEVIGPESILLGGPGSAAPAGETIEALEAAHIRAIFLETGGNVSQAARRLGIDRTTLYRKMERYGIERPGERSSSNGSQQ